VKHVIALQQVAKANYDISKSQLKKTQQQQPQCSKIQVSQ
jgi:hypothetical protein